MQNYETIVLNSNGFTFISEEEFKEGLDNVCCITKYNSNFKDRIINIMFVENSEYAKKQQDEILKTIRNFKSYDLAVESLGSSIQALDEGESYIDADILLNHDIDLETFQGLLKTLSSF